MAYIIACDVRVHVRVRLRVRVRVRVCVRMHIHATPWCTIYGTWQGILSPKLGMHGQHVDARIASLQHVDTQGKKNLSTGQKNALEVGRYCLRRWD